MRADILKRERNLDAIKEYLRIHKKATMLEVGGSLSIPASTLKDYFTALCRYEEIKKVRNFHPDGRINRAALWSLFDAEEDPAIPQSQAPVPVVIRSNCNWIGANEWRRGEHGRDAMAAALFGRNSHA